MRGRGPAALALVLVLGGCTTISVNVDPGDSAPPPYSAPPTTRNPPGSPVPVAPPAPASKGATAIPWCRLADVTFRMAVGTTAGASVSGSLFIGNVSGGPCALAGYPSLRWHDGYGAVLPMAVTHPGTAGRPVVIPPGRTGTVALAWNRYRSAGSTATCLPYPSSLDIWLPATSDDPHPEQGPAAHADWVSGDNASVCGGTVGVGAVDLLR